jgi:hypothetical protein
MVTLLTINIQLNNYLIISMLWQHFEFELINLVSADDENDTISPN